MRSRLDDFSLINVLPVFLSENRTLPVRVSMLTCRHSLSVTTFPSRSAAALKPRVAGVAMML